MREMRTLGILFGLVLSAQAAFCDTTNLAPVILAQPEGQTTYAGSNVVLRVEASGSPPLAYQWRRNGLWLDGGTNPTLIFSNIQPYSSGLYSVLVTNAYGQVESSTAQLTVIGYAPVITSQPASTNVFAGQTASFRVSATGTPTPKFQWFKSGTPLAGATSSVYTILNVQSNQADSYWAVASNQFGVVQSLKAALKVLPAPACAPPPSGLVSWWKGQNNLLDSWGDNSASALSTATYADGIVGRAFSNPLLVAWDSPTLRATNELTLQAWLYASNWAGTTPRTIVSKFVTAAGLVPAGQSSYYLGITNGWVYFMLSSGSSPPTNYAVLRAAKPLAAGQWNFVVATYDGSTLRLYLDGILSGAAYFGNPIFPGSCDVGIGCMPFARGSTYVGSYPLNGLLDELCIYNQALSLEEIQAIYAANLTGMCSEPPTVIAGPTDQAVPLGEDARFSVSVSGTRPMSYQWFRGQTILTGATNSTLVFGSVQSNLIGSYSARVTNALGSLTSPAAQLTVLPPPQCVAPPAGLIGWWPADGSGLEAISGSSAVVSAFVSYPTGKVSRAFALTNSNAQIRMSNTAAFNFGNNADFSIEGWVKLSPPAGTIIPPPLFKATTNQIIVTKRSPLSPIFGRDGAGYTLSVIGGRLSLTLATNSTLFNASTTFSSGPDLRDSLFHHVGVSVRRSVSNGGQFYVDGEPVLTFDPTPFRGSLSNSSPLMIGTSDTYSEGSVLNGLLDELAIYNRALSAEEMLALRRAGSAGKCKAPPSIATQPTNQFALLGQNATFRVAATGTGNLRYQWIFNGAPLASSTTSTLIVTNVQPNKLGTYWVLVSNSFGSVKSADARLIQNRQPQALCRDAVVAAGPDCQAPASVNVGSTDPDNDPLTLSQVPPGPYSLGTTMVTLVVADNKGASNVCFASVSVVDRTAPALLVAADLVTTNEPGQCGAVVWLPPPQATDTCSAVTNLSCTPPPGSFFPVGSSLVRCSATDSAGNTALGSFSVVVHDAEPPRITCPDNLVVTNTHDAWMSTITYTVSALDNCPGVGAPICNPASGSAFGIGTHTVTCSAIDAAGNASQCRFKVTVQPGNVPPHPVIEVSPLAHFPGFTNLIVIAPDGQNALARFDGSGSTDPDDEKFNFVWLEDQVAFSTNALCSRSLAVGDHTVTLWLDDTYPLGTNAASVELNVISPAQAVAIIVGMVNQSTPGRNTQPLLASLQAAAAAFERGNYTAAMNQLDAFLKKVNTQVRPFDPGLADRLVNSIDIILRAFNSAARTGAAK